MAEITLTINSRLEDVLLVALAVNRLSAALFSQEDAWRIELSVVEAVTNVIKHAYLNTPDKEVSVALSFQDDRLRIQVRDSGCAMDPQLLKDRDARVFCFSRRNVQALPESGRGIALINQLMDEVCYVRNRGRNTLTLTKYLNSRQRNL